MLDKKFIKKIAQTYADYDAARREVIKSSGDALALCKKAIFAFHRGDTKDGDKSLNDAERSLKSLDRLMRENTGLDFEGSFRAALEEYVEARLFGLYIRGKTLGEIKSDYIDEDIYLGGLMDCTGEMVRHAVLAATAGKRDEVLRAKDTVTEIAGEIIHFNMTGALRQKYDQLKTNLRKLEEMAYDLSLRR